MFVFDNVLDKDVKSYEYQLYKADQVTGSFPNYTLIANPTIYLTGESGSNVFAVAVENSTDVANIRYYGRVRTKDTSNNYSSWSPLVLSDQDTPLIGNQFIASLTAAKITAGKIGAHEIILSQAGPQTNIAAPSNMAILRSSDYNGSYSSNTWTNGSSGWIIAGDGHAEFSSASLRGGLKAQSVYIDAHNRWRRNSSDTDNSLEFKVGSNDKYLYFDGTDIIFSGNLSAAGGTFSGAISGGTIDIGGLDATSFHVDSAGNMWLGASTYAAAPFKVSSAGDFSATSGSISGSLISGGTVSGTSININSGTFQVTSAGALTALSANISGIVNATSGSIAGWSISNDMISAAGGDIALYQEPGYGALIAGTGPGQQISITSDADFYCISNNVETTINMPQSVGGNFFTFVIKQVNSTLNATRIAPSLISIVTPNNQITLSANDGIGTNLPISSGSSIQGSSLYASGSVTGADLYASGSVTGANITATNIVTGTNLVQGAYFRGTGTEGVPTNQSQAIRRRNSDGYYLIDASRRELKENIEEINGALAKLKLLRPVSFEWKDKSSYDTILNEELRDKMRKMREYGFVAEEVQEVDPWLSSYDTSKDDPTLIPTMWQQNALIALCVSSIKEIAERLVDLENS